MEYIIINPCTVGMGNLLKEGRAKYFQIMDTLASASTTAGKEHPLQAMRYLALHVCTAYVGRL